MLLPGWLWPQPRAAAGARQASSPLAFSALARQPRQLRLPPLPCPTCPHPNSHVCPPATAQAKEGDAFNRELQEQRRQERIAEREAKEKEHK